jgi:hypothetical protein
MAHQYTSPVDKLARLILKQAGRAKGQTFTRSRIDEWSVGKADEVTPP